MRDILVAVNVLAGISDNGQGDVLFMLVPIGLELGLDDRRLRLVEA